MSIPGKRKWRGSKLFFARSAHEIVPLDVSLPEMPERTQKTSPPRSTSREVGLNNRSFVAINLKEGEHTIYRRLQAYLILSSASIMRNMHAMQ